MKIKAHHKDNKLIVAVQDTSTIQEVIKELLLKFQSNYTYSNVLLQSEDGYTFEPTSIAKDVLKDDCIVHLVPKDYYFPIEKFGTLHIHSQKTKSILSEFSYEERKIRIQLAAAYRLFDMFNWTDTIYGHLTARIPNSHHFLINPFGLLYSEITASSLVKVDLDGNIIHKGTTDFGINRAGYVIHSAIHEHRKDVTCVMHCHQPDASAISCEKDGLKMISQTSHICGQVAYHDYEGIAVDKEERKRIAKDLGDKNILILRNHGVVTCGKTVGEAFLLMYNLIAACKIQVKTSKNVILPSTEIALKSYQISHGFNSEGFGQRELSAYMRKLDNLDPSYKL